MGIISVVKLLIKQDNCLNNFDVFQNIHNVNADTGNVMKYEIEPENVAPLVEGFLSMHKALASVPSTA